MAILQIHTDGACSGNQNERNLGGWGAVLEYGEHRKELWGAEADTTNNRMEMTALLEAFRAVTREGLEILVFSDSAYLMDCFRKRWYVNWQKNGWRTAKKQPVENRDLWEALLPFLDLHSIRFCRVKGHVDPALAAEDEALFAKFLEWNGTDFSREDYLHATEMNNLADALANRGVDSLR